MELTPEQFFAGLTAVIGAVFSGVAIILKIAYGMYGRLERRLEEQERRCEEDAKRQDAKIESQSSEIAGLRHQLESKDTEIASLKNQNAGQARQIEELTEAVRQLKDDGRAWGNVH